MQAEYYVVQGGTAEELTQTVNLYLRDGGHCVGGVCVAVVDYTRDDTPLVVWAQAMLVPVEVFAREAADAD